MVGHHQDLNISSSFPVRDIDTALLTTHQQLLTEWFQSFDGGTTRSLYVGCHVVM